MSTINITMADDGPIKYINIKTAEIPYFDEDGHVSDNEKYQSILNYYEDETEKMLDEGSILSYTKEWSKDGLSQTRTIIYANSAAYIAWEHMKDYQNVPEYHQARWDYFQKNNITIKKIFDFSGNFDANKKNHY